jgi:hypothetical protein
MASKKPKYWAFLATGWLGPLRRARRANPPGGLKLMIQAHRAAGPGATQKLSGLQRGQPIRWDETARLMPFCSTQPIREQSLRF